MNALAAYFLKFFDGQNTILAGLGLWGLALYQLTQRHFDGALEAFLLGWSALGLRHSIFKASGK